MRSTLTILAVAGLTGLLGRLALAEEGGYEVVPVEDGGSIAGVVRFTGSTPEGEEAGAGGLRCGPEGQITGVFVILTRVREAPPPSEAPPTTRPAGEGDEPPEAGTEPAAGGEEQPPAGEGEAQTAAGEGEAQTAGAEAGAEGGEGEESAAPTGQEEPAKDGTPPEETTEVVRPWAGHLSGRGWTSPPDGYRLSIAGGQCVPASLVVPAGATVTVVASGEGTHRVRSAALLNEDLDVRLEPGQEAPLVLEREELVSLVCDEHPGEQALLLVAPHPYATVTDDQGAFQLAEVPPGEYEITVRGEAFAPVTRLVVVRAGEEAEAPVEVTSLLD